MEGKRLLAYRTRRPAYAALFPKGLVGANIRYTIMLKPRHWHWLLRQIVIGGGALILCLLVGAWLDREFWWTPDQRGDLLSQKGRLEEAAKTYSDPLRVGIAQYRSGEFKEAAQTFARVPGAVGAFNRGNALLMHGAYDQAIEAYDLALSFRPDWKEAEENRELAAVRRDKIQNASEGAAVAPEDKPSAVTFEKMGENKPSETVELAQGDEDSDAVFRALWLRRVQTTPADFLRTKFAYQAQAQKSSAASGGNK